VSRFCPTCGAVVSADDLAGRAACRACQRTPVRRAGREVPRPPHFRVRDDARRLRICYRWVWSRFTQPALICLIWNGFLFGFWWAALRGAYHPMIWLALVIMSLHFVVGLGLIYATLAGLLNRTAIEATSEAVTVRNGPLPWWGNARVLTSDLDRLTCERGSSSGKGEEAPRSGYRVSAWTKGAGPVDLVQDLEVPGQARFIIQELERRLKIGEHRAGHEVRS
jgi:hypothetical protein